MCETTVPRDCWSCRVGKLVVVNGGVLDEGPGEHYFACKLGLETCDANGVSPGDRDEFQCAMWWATDSDVWAHKEW